MSIATEIERLITAKSEITSALEKKGVDVDSLAKIDGYGEKVLELTQKVKSYHYLEAFEVAKKIENIKSQNPTHRYVTFGCITDSHVDDGAGDASEEESKASIKSGAFALETVGNLVDADFLVNLGDNSVSNDFSENECLASQKYLRDVCVSSRNSREMFHLVGNHDRSINTIDVYNMIGALNNFDTPTGDSASLYTPQRSYGYKDFSDYKLRVICLNTTDYWNVMGGNGMSYEQKKLFSEFLDLSDKADASQWQILILSHIPLDFEGGSDNKCADLKKILDAYQAGGSATIEVSSDYSKTDNVTSSFTVSYSNGKNAAKIICNIHGHLHMIREQENPDNDILQICTPNTCGIAHYSAKDNGTIAQKYNYEGTACEKEQGTAKDTACTWYVIDLDANVIYSYIYGARNDVERLIPYSTAPRFKIINNLTDCTTDSTRISIREGSIFSETITAKDGYELKNVSVTMGGEDITDDVYSNKVITIKNITGDVIVTATAVSNDSGTSYKNELAGLTDSQVKSGYRYNSSGGFSAGDFWIALKDIPCTHGDKIYVYLPNNKKLGGTSTQIVGFFTDAGFKKYIAADSKGVTVYDNSNALTGTKWVLDTSELNTNDFGAITHCHIVGSPNGSRTGNEVVTVGDSSILELDF